MRSRNTLAVILLTALGVAGVTATASADGTEPPITTTTVTVTETVGATYQGWTIRKWANHAVANKRALNQEHANSVKRGIVIRKLRAANREELEMGSEGLSSAFMCIHHFEGSWRDPNAPYWGGVQMDRSFMSTYGAPFYKAWGTADHWPPFIQVAVAEAAFLSGRGFHPWPNTARYCGLL